MSSKQVLPSHRLALQQHCHHPPLQYLRSIRCHPSKCQDALRHSWDPSNSDLTCDCACRISDSRDGACVVSSYRASPSEFQYQTSSFLPSWGVPPLFGADQDGQYLIKLSLLFVALMFSRRTVHTASSSRGNWSCHF